MKVAKDLINQHKLVFGGAFRKIQEVKQSALVRPTDHLLLQVDGMDNHKSYLPRYLQNAKELQGTERLASKISGCILWSGLYEAKRKLVFYLNHDQVCFQYNICAKNSTNIIWFQFENASNMIITLIHHLLEEFVRDHGMLPRNLHLNLGEVFSSIQYFRN